jgi:hypothetical protein
MSVVSVVGGSVVGGSVVGGSVDGGAVVGGTVVGVVVGTVVGAVVRGGAVVLWLGVVVLVGPDVVVCRFGASGSPCSPSSPPDGVVVVLTWPDGVVLGTVASKMLGLSLPRYRNMVATDRAMISAQRVPMTSPPRTCWDRLREA